MFHSLLSLNILEFSRMLAQSYGGYGYNNAYVTTTSSSFNPIGVLLALAGAAVFGFVIWMFIDCATRPVKNKVMWLVLIGVGGLFSGGLLALVAAIVYALTDRNKLAVAPVVQPNESVAPIGDSVTLPQKEQPQAPTSITSQPQYVKHTTTLGKVIAIIAAVIGALTLAFVIMIVVALIQCARDPKCI